MSRHPAEPLARPGAPGAVYCDDLKLQPDNAALREWRIRSWRERIAPEGYSLHGDPRRWEQTRYARAELSELGEKLLGSRPW
ncbi:hypothetical protein LP419_22780 [Massilia sp. H-1]|nr:hypothetical protein LP419_22780 [Massilia sp. H-1]